MRFVKGRLRIWHPLLWMTFICPRQSFRNDRAYNQRTKNVIGIVTPSGCLLPDPSANVECEDMSVSQKQEPVLFRDFTRILGQQAIFVQQHNLILSDS